MELKTIISKKTKSEILRWETVLNNDIQKEKIYINSIIDKYKTYIYSQCNITKNKYDIIFTYGGSKSNNFILDRNKSPFYKNNHKSEDEYRIFQSRSKESYINKYGDAEGNIKYNSFLNKIREKNQESY